MCKYRVGMAAATRNLLSKDLSPATEATLCAMFGTEDPGAIAKMTQDAIVERCSHLACAEEEAWRPEAEFDIGGLVTIAKYKEGTSASGPGELRYINVRTVLNTAVGQECFPTVVRPF